jgi:hypothetical protein
MAHRISPVPAGYREPAYDLLGVLGLVVGAIAAVTAYGITRSPALAAGAFILVSYLLGRVAPDLLTEADRIHHAAYLLIGPVLGVPSAFVLLALATPAWLAVALGVVVGGGGQLLLGHRFLREVFEEEAGLDVEGLHLHLPRRR